MKPFSLNILGLDYFYGKKPTSNFLFLIRSWNQTVLQIVFLEGNQKITTVEITFESSKKLMKTDYTYVVQMLTVPKILSCIQT